VASVLRRRRQPGHQTDQTGLTTYSYDNLDRQINKALPGANLALGYDLVGDVASYTDPGGTVSYGFDAVNELTSLTEPSGARTTFGYNNDAVRISTTYPGGTVLANTPDNSMRTAEIKATNGSNVFSVFTYSYANGSGTPPSTGPVATRWPEPPPTTPTTPKPSVVSYFRVSFSP